ncbi:MAG: glutamine-hydrolyzing carbamoyl-phosphate synthase small subunit [Pseudomonadota bacterium]|nr:glutamine-hydrolyzing carbamoyl-phosphate synthase small subunit [Pseudomonadota bacterium]
MISKYIIDQMKNTVKTNGKNCLLLLEDGTHLYGCGFGHNGDFIGEICFNTSITGYQEILTDPSYFNQIINFTFPHIGIVGTNLKDYESERVFASGCIVNNRISKASNFRSELDFDKWLKVNETVCITGIDTRVLTKKIRNLGACKALIHFPKKSNFKDINILRKNLENSQEMKNLDLASSISTKDIYHWQENKKKVINKKKIKRKFIAVIDFGVKKNILNLLESNSYQVIVFPIDFPIKKLISMKPTGIFLSNGPGDPMATFKKYEKNLLEIKNYKRPVFGICLGHQILSLLYNAKTEKMHHGHRGANHPIKNIKTKKVEITVQNHGFVVSKKKFPKNLNITHSSLFDRTIAGIEVKNKPFFSVQYHPESSPGPQDSRYLFNKFMKLIKNA